MFDSLLDLLERDKQSSSRSSSGGLRGRLSSVLDGTRNDDRRSSDRDSRQLDGDRDDDDRHPKRNKKREFDFLDFGD